MKICFMKGAQACDRYRSDCRQILANVPGLKSTRLIFEADVILQFFCIENDSCIQEAARQIRYIGKFKKKGAKVIVAGCAANIIGDDFLKFKEVDYVISNKPVAKTLLKEIFGIEECKNQYSLNDDLPNEFNFEIGEGCFKKCGSCSFCFNCLAKIPVRSKPIETILEAVQDVTSKGAYHITLMSLNTTIYGIDFTEHRQVFHELIQRVSENPNVSLIDIYSLTVHNMYPELLNELMSNSKIKMIEIGIQTGSDKVHKIMNTGATTEMVINIFESLKFKSQQLKPLFIIGHPGETEEDFELTLDLIQKYNLCCATITPYICVQGTPASRMEQVADEVKFKRYKRAEALVKQLNYEYKNSLVGKVQTGYVSSVVHTENNHYIYIRHSDSILTFIATLTHAEFDRFSSNKCSCHLVEFTIPANTYMNDELIYVDLKEVD